LTIRDRIGKYDTSRGRFRTWLWHVTYNALIDTWQTKGREISNCALIELNAAPPSAVNEVPPRSIQVRMIEAMGELLSQDDRDLLQATIVYSRPMAEVAKSLGLSVSNGYVRKSRALKLLQERLVGLEDDYLSDL